MIPNPAQKPFNDILQKIFVEKRTINPRFSLRAYSRVLNIPVATLSQLMSGKRGLSLKNAIKIADAMEASSEERRRLIETFVNGNKPPLSVREMNDDEFQEISDWYYFAILNFWQLQDCNSSPKWVARKLGISEIEARYALQQLQSLGLINTDHGDLRLSTRPIRARHVVHGGKSLRKFHRQMIEKSIDAMENLPQDKRSFSTMTFSIKKEDLPKLNQKIAEFMEQFGKPKLPRSQEQVYAINVQLVPLTKE